MYWSACSMQYIDESCCCNNKDDNGNHHIIKCFIRVFKIEKSNQFGAKHSGLMGCFFCTYFLKYYLGIKQFNLLKGSELLL